MNLQGGALGTLRTIQWVNGKVVLVDQNRLPEKLGYITCATFEEVAACIRNMSVRGAPALGVAAAMGITLAALGSPAGNRSELLTELREAGDKLRVTRPTAVNISWAVERMLRRVEATPGSVEAVKAALVEEALEMAEEDVRVNKALGEHGQTLLEDGDRVLTHCNAGALATVGWGTALGVIRSAFAHGKSIRVYASETRPRLQGARLTAYELSRDCIPVTVITDNMVGYCMAQGMVDKVVVGGDRVASNGDTANKIGTYGIAVLAERHGIPFYVAAPTSSIDLSKTSGKAITIEERDHREVMEVLGRRVIPEGVEVINPAFDVTPQNLITAIITEKGVLNPPYGESIRKALLGRD